MQEKKLYIIAMIGALICFTGDILLGFFIDDDRVCRGLYLLILCNNGDWHVENPDLLQMDHSCIAPVTVSSSLSDIWQDERAHGIKLQQ